MAEARGRCSRREAKECRACGKASRSAISLARATGKRLAHELLRDPDA